MPCNVPRNVNEAGHESMMNELPQLLYRQSALTFVKN